MDKQTVIRRVRIAVSVFFGVVAVAVLCVLWVRSYWWNEMVSRSDHMFVAIGSNTGCFYIIQSQSAPDSDGTQWAFDHDVAIDLPADFSWMRTARTSSLRIPHWSLVLSCATLAAIPWASRHFSVRTILVAATLVAAVLGLGGWLTS